jgi:hypothetical protein
METLGVGASDSVKPTHLTPRSWEKLGRALHEPRPPRPGPHLSGRGEVEALRKERISTRSASSSSGIPSGIRTPSTCRFPQPFFYDQKPVRGTRSLTAS